MSFIRHKEIEVHIKVPVRAHYNCTQVDYQVVKNACRTNIFNAVLNQLAETLCFRK